MNNEHYKKLVDLYAGKELPEELEQEMEWAAFGDAELSHEMATLRRTVDLLHSAQDVEFTEESYQRVLMRLYSRGVEPETQSQPSPHFQYHLPMQG